MINGCSLCVHECYDLMAKSAVLWAQINVGSFLASRPCLRVTWRRHDSWPYFTWLTMPFPLRPKLFMHTYAINYYYNTNSCLYTAECGPQSAKSPSKELFHKFVYWIRSIAAQRTELFRSLHLCWNSKWIKHTKQRHCSSCTCSKNRTQVLEKTVVLMILLQWQNRADIVVIAYKKKPQILMGKKLLLHSNKFSNLITDFHHRIPSCQ